MSSRFVLHDSVAMIVKSQRLNSALFPAEFKVLFSRVMGHVTVLAKLIISAYHT